MCKPCYQALASGLLNNEAVYQDEFFRLFKATGTRGVVEYVFGTAKLPGRAFTVCEGGQAAFDKQQRWGWGEVVKWTPLAHKVCIDKFPYADKDELVSEIGLLTLLRCAVTYDSSTGWTFQAYASGALENRYRTYLAGLPNNEALPESLPCPAEIESNPEEILNQLKPEDARILRAKILDERSHQDIGYEMSLSRSTVHVRIKTALQNARKIIR